MLHKLKYILITIIILSLTFVCCMICYVSADGQLIYYEKSKNNLLNFNSTYDKVFYGLVSDAKEYIATGDASAKYKFTNDANDFISCNNANTNYLNFSDRGELSDFQLPDDHSTSADETLTTFSFDSKEQNMLLSYLNGYNQMLDIILSAVDQKDLSLFRSSTFYELYDAKIDLKNQYTAHYMDRIKEKEKNLQFFLHFISTFSIFIGTILALAVSKGVSLYLKNNQYNAYFNQLYSKAIENADVGMAIVDKHYKYEYMNATYKQLFNIQSPNPLGQTAFAVLPQEIAATLPSHSFAENKKNISLSYTYEGTMRYINYNCFAIFDDNDEPKFVTLIQDCTDSKRKDHELKQQLKEIEFFANAKSSFVANVSHEIKTPLNVICGMVHILKGTELTNKQNDILSKIHISSELLLNIINDVLDISKIQKSNFILYPSDFSLMNMLNESEEIFRPIIYNKGLEFIKDFKFPPDLCLSTDKTRLAQVLLNLINNACKFTTSGHIRLVIEQLDSQKNSVLLKFTLEDTGMGIDEEDIPKVFQEFEQLENHLTKQHQGTGLGLAICKHVVHAMGGDIWVESQKGTGSRFQFTIWTRTVDPALCDVSSTASGSLSVLNGEGHRVLVVEDTELNYEVTQNMLGDSHIICEHACDGQEAIDMCIKVPEDYYTLILMDIHMPNMDGYTAAEILKTEIGVTCPILALTATNIDAETKEKYKGIMDGFISKPFRYKEFYRALLPYFGSVQDSDSLSSSAESESPETPDNLNLAEAAKNLGCSEKQYIKHLTKFKTSYAHVDNDIQELLLDKNFTEAHRIAHSVKGLAGTLGLIPLQQVASELEEALKEESEKATTLLPMFRYELDGVCKEGSDCN
ncbi:ATP-binding protein [Aminipila luticellarii]|nr:ATP-binding protein [Aminipila luticellarii]